MLLFVFLRQKLSQGIFENIVHYEEYLKKSFVSEINIMIEVFLKILEKICVNDLIKINL
jgi:hypothetical protein